MKLRPFQREGVQQIYQFGGRALLGDEMGLGKTIQSLFWISKIPKRRPVVIVTPASVKYTWQAEAALHFGMRTEVLEGRRPKRQRDLPGDIVILNYDILHSWLPALVRAQPQCVVFDECQFIKELKAKRTKAARLLAHNVSSVLALSGTPIINRPIEFWPVLSIIRPDLFPDRIEFAWRYCKPKWTPWGWNYNGARHLGELNRILKRTCMIRRLKADVLHELPEKTRRYVPFRLDSYKEYRKAENTFIEWLTAISPAKAERAKRSKALTKVGYLLRLVAKLKLDWTTKWIEEFFIAHPGEKLIAFSMNTFVIDHLHKCFPNSVILDGRVQGRKRMETVRKFQSNRKVNLLLGHWKAVIGVTLHAASNVAALDFPWAPGDLLQGEDRAHRIGQTKHVIVHYLIALKTIEEKLIRALRNKAKVLDAVLNGGRSVKDLNIFESLLEELHYG